MSSLLESLPSSVTLVADVAFLFTLVLAREGIVGAVGEVRKAEEG